MLLLSITGKVLELNGLIPQHGYTYVCIPLAGWGVILSPKIGCFSKVDETLAATA